MKIEKLSTEYRISNDHDESIYMTISDSGDLTLQTDKSDCNFCFLDSDPNKSLRIISLLKEGCEFAVGASDMRGSFDA